MSFILSQLGTNGRNVTVDLSGHAKSICVQWMSETSISCTYWGASYLWYEDESLGSYSARQRRAGVWEQEEGGEGDGYQKDRPHRAGLPPETVLELYEMPQPSDFTQLRSVLVEH